VAIFADDDVVVHQMPSGFAILSFSAKLCSQNSSGVGYPSAASSLATAPHVPARKKNRSLAQ
jgi:hypothetical protein